MWQLFGQQKRKRVKVGAWFISSPPEKMAEVVKEYAAMGHTWMKIVSLPAAGAGAVAAVPSSLAAAASHGRGIVGLR